MGFYLLTGATGGLGKAIAMRLAKSGKNLLLTSTNLEKLESLKTSLVEAYMGVYVEIFAADLTKKEDRAALFDFARNLEFDGIYNVAGIDNQMPFNEYTEEKLVRQIRLNFEAAASLTLFALNHSKYLKVSNISSVSGEQPLAYFQVYSATKSALTYFSQALDRELRESKRGHVTTIIAGGILTRDDVIEYIDGEGFYGRKAAKTPEYVAAKCIKATEKSKKKYIVGTLNRITLFVGRFIPNSLKMRFMSARLKHTTKNYY